MCGYRPETDTSHELKYERVTQYQDMVGVLRWAVELGRFDILLETVLISTYLNLLRRGYLEQVFHVVRYLRANQKINICFDPKYTTINYRLFDAHDWYDQKKICVDKRRSEGGDIIRRPLSTPPKAKYINT